MPANYNCLLFDLDGTLLDFAAAEREAVGGTLEKHGLPNDDDTIARFSAINAALWAQLEKGEIKKDKLVVQRFQKLLDELAENGIVPEGEKPDPIRMNNDYMTLLSAAATAYPGVEDLLRELAEFATLAVVTNGHQKVQLQRLEKSGLLSYFDEIFVSEKLGCTKPSPKFFDIALKKLGIRNKERVLVIGDSLGADIKGGNAAGLATCWCNYNDTENTSDVQPTHTIQDLAQLPLIAVGEEELKLAQTREKRHVV